MTNTHNKTDQWLPLDGVGRRERPKGFKNVHYLDYGAGFIGVDICQDLTNYTLNKCSLLCVSYSWIQLL